MQVVFLNTMEKQTDEGGIQNAQLSICEQQGKWQVIWQEDGQASEQESLVWFEGASWEEMLLSFRIGAATKMGEGFVPVIDGMLDDRKRMKSASGATYLQCYGELHGNAKLFEELRAWRRSKMVELRKPAYLIANNQMMWMLSAFVPHTEAEIMQIPGWGKAKNEAYRNEVLAIMAEYEQPHPFPLDWVAHTIDPKRYMQWLYKQKEESFKLEMQWHQEKRLILEGVQDGHSLDQLRSVVDIPTRELLIRMEQFEREGYDLETFIERELENVPDHEQQRLWDALETVGDRYLKPVLKQAYNAEELKSSSIEVLYDRLRLVRLRYRRKLNNADAV
ncbi:aldolase [Paenibacillaceae bacterium]|nr:aldolase [Paenibacillaceae bacterium]